MFIEVLAKVKQCFLSFPLLFLSIAPTPVSSVPSVIWGRLKGVKAKTPFSIAQFNERNVCCFFQSQLLL